MTGAFCNEDNPCTPKEFTTKKRYATTGRLADVADVVATTAQSATTFAASGGPVTAGTHLRVWPDDWCYADEYNEKILDYWVNPRDDRDE